MHEFSRIGWLWLLVFSLTFGTPARGEEKFEAALTFETPPQGDWPGGWGGGPAGTAFIDSTIVHGGRFAARLHRDVTSPKKFTTLTKKLDIDFAGKFVELRGWLRTEEVSEFAGLWMREDAAGSAVAFDNMQQRKLDGTTDWTEYRITLPLEEDADDLVFGALVAGTGTLWVDDLELLVDGKPVTEAPRLEREPTVLDTDHEFDAGSGVVGTPLSDPQIANLATLGKIWGFLKYHHPAVAAGEHHWDYELFRILPDVLTALDREAANDAIDGWIAGLGEIPPCDPCAEPPTDVHLTADVAWLSDEEMLGEPLSARLGHVYKNRAASKTQFYLSLMPQVGNARFDHELPYMGREFPDAGYQLLGLVRFWNAVNYWFPYRDMIEEDWDAVLAEFVPRVFGAQDRDAYQLEMMALIARIHDTHANLWSSLNLRPPRGDAGLPVVVRFVEGEAVVTEFSHDWHGAKSGLERGDVVLELDGRAISDLVEEWRPLYAASNEPTRLRDVARSLTRGARGPCEVVVRRGDEVLTFNCDRVPLEELDQQTGRTHDLPGEACRRLGEHVGYLKIGGLETALVSSCLETVSGTRGLIIDIRNYPTEFPLFELGRHLVAEATEFVRFTHGDPANPGAMEWGNKLSLFPGKPHYPGKVLILVDEVTQSSAEYHAMAFRAAPQNLVVGSTTAGADGNVSRLPLPGGLYTLFSGIGVFYPDGAPTQRVGIVPDVAIQPTQQGIREGRDEVLELAVGIILGDDVTLEEITKLISGE